MKIAYLSEFDPQNVLSWSGCSYYFARALSEQPSVKVEFLGPLQQKSSAIFNLKARFYSICGRNYIPIVEPRVLKDYARQSSIALSNSDAEIVLALNAMPIAYLKTNKPILYFWDSTFLGNLEYPFFSRLASETVRHGHRMVQMALDNCRLAAFSSEWAVQTALDGYHVDRTKLRIVPLGANLICNRTFDDILRIVEGRSVSRCDLLFLGVEWHRKGGDVAYNVAKQLNARGLETTLTIVGCKPEINEPIPNFVVNLGFLNKFENNNAALIERLLSKAHFLIVPSIAESFGAVFCEASSFGTPSLARRVGGVPAAVTDGVNGKLFSKDADVSAYCDYILDVFGNYAKYKHLALSSFKQYEARLNWAHTSKLIVELCRKILDVRTKC